jgi:hypothetical protein
MRHLQQKANGKHIVNIFFLWSDLVIALGRRRPIQASLEFVFRITKALMAREVSRQRIADSR